MLEMSRLSLSQMSEISRLSHKSAMSRFSHNEETSRFHKSVMSLLDLDLKAKNIFKYTKIYTASFDLWILHDPKICPQIKFRPQKE